MRRMRGGVWIALAVAGIAVLSSEGTAAHAAGSRAAGSRAGIPADAPAALTGTVSSTEEGAMEGVLVSAKRDGATITVTVDSDDHGRYSFPRNRLEPGHYSLRIRAVGYELDGPASADIAAGKAATADLKLRKAKDLAAQLTNTEWLLSMPGTDEQKYMMSNCGNCHTYERVVRSQYNADDFIDILKLMASFAQGSTPAHPSKRGLEQLGPTGMIGTPKTAEFLSTINLSDGRDQWAYPLKTLPRPTGRATRVIVTEYDLARRDARPHDVVVDPEGLVWYRDFATEIFGSLDPKTGKVVDYPIPGAKPGFAQGEPDMEMDQYGNLWTALQSGTIVKFDHKTHEFSSWSANEKANFQMISPVYEADGKVKVWISGSQFPGMHRLDLATGKLEQFDSTPFYGVVTDSKGNGYGLLLSTQDILKYDAITGEITHYPTPTKGSGPRRGRADSQDRLWFGEFRGNKIGMFDTHTGTFKEWPVPTPWSGPYDAVLDKNGDAWTGGMFSDRVVRVNTTTGQAVEYLMPRSTNIRRVFVDNSTTPVTFWTGSNHGGTIVKVEPLE
jgi:streptogramin lyase